MDEGTLDAQLLRMAAQDEALARQAAQILGPSSAAQEALDSAQRSRDAGVPAAVIRYRQSWVVVRAASIREGED